MVSPVIVEPDAFPAEASITISRAFVHEDRTVMVDTNYLHQLNENDLMSMLFDRNYENSISSPWKRQMSKMFRDALGGRIDLCFSNLILREFIGLAPRRTRLVELYRRYFSVVAPKENFESCFFDLAGAINALVAETGRQGDVKDAYSYIIAALAHVRYFITEDQDLRSLYSYLIGVRHKGYQEIAKDIKKIRDAFAALSKTSGDDFPLAKILERLYWGPLPIPVSVLDLKHALADVLTKTETMLVMVTSLAGIDSMLTTMQESKIETPKEFDGKTCEAARTRIESVAKSIEIEPEHLMVDTFRIALVEKESAWTESADDNRLADALGLQLEILQELLYAEEEEDYESLEERYNAEELTKTFFVKCEECETKSEVVTEYQGVVETDQRAMGTEYTHVWSGDWNCPHCKNDLHVEYTRWEYPMGWLNFDDLEANGCEIVQEPAPDKAQTTLD